MNKTDTIIRNILNTTKTIACVGASPNKLRPSYFVLRYLYLRKFKIIPINPNFKGQTLFGERFLGSVSEIKQSTNIDMLNIFRKSESVLPIVIEGLSNLVGLKTIWMQIGVNNAEARKLAISSGLEVIENRCPKIEHQRIFGELRMSGFNTGIISSKLVIN
jgi:predicted CoA-binding protein